MPPSKALHLNPVLRLGNSVRTTLTCMFLFAVPLQAAVLDPASEPDSVLAAVAESLDAAGIDVAYNLNLREIANGKPERPVLGGLADLPPPSLPLTPELNAWEAAYGRDEIGLIVVLPEGASGITTSNPNYEEFYESWLSAEVAERYVVSYEASDDTVAMAVVEAFRASHVVMQIPPLTRSVLTASVSTDPVELAGRLYVLAGRRLVIDSGTARDYESEIAEFAYLGQSVRRDSNSVINPESRALRRIASAEPEVFRKESLGDEFEASTIPEIIVPGGIAFGETAVFDSTLVSLIYDGNRFWLETTQGRSRLPEESSKDWKADFDFAVRSAQNRSDAIVDIDERSRVRISSALEDTDVGVEMIRIDNEPFNYVRQLDVRKSVIVDSSVRFMGVDDSTEFETEYEVRFLQADKLRIARTQAAVVYRYASATREVRHWDAWGPDAYRLEGRTDFEKMGNSTAGAGRHAAWIALVRGVVDHSLDFSRGRYEFMKIDKAGRNTPSRL